MASSPDEETVVAVGCLGCGGCAVLIALAFIVPVLIFLWRGALGF